METRNNIRPYKAVHPGSILKEELEARGIKQKDFALLLGMKPSNLNAIISGKRNITKSIAQKIAEQLTGITADFWLRVQKGYNESIKETSIKTKEQPKTESPDVAILKHFSIIENELQQLRRLLITK